MTKQKDKRFAGNHGDSKAESPPKKAKAASKAPLVKSIQPPSARRKLLTVDQDQSSAKPSSDENISSNWKAFLQVQSAAAASGPAAAAAPARGRPRGLARRGCSCPPPVWFDGVDPALLDRPPACDFCRRRSDKERRSGEKQREKDEREEKEAAQLAKAKTPQPSHYLAMDCEMVGVGHSGQESMLARVSIVNSLCQPVYDKFVKPKERVTDYRTAVSGVRPKDIARGEEFEVVQREVAALLKGRVLVGHAVHNDLKVLLLSHPRRHTRDTASYKPFRKMFNGGIPSLKNLAHKVLAVDIQKGEHDSVQDARATMQIYQTHRREWEAAVAERHRRRTGKPTR